MTQTQPTTESPPITIRRHTDATLLNQIANDDSVRPWICGQIEGKLDLTALVSDPNNYLLMGEHGGVFYHCLQPGLYEAHTQVLPEGRGRWTVAMVKKSLHWMFTKTDAVELLTRVPEGNTPALALTKRIGGEFEFTRPAGWFMNGRLVPTDIYSLNIQRWMRDADGLEIRGRWVDNKIKKELRRQDKTVTFIHDQSHDRYAGAAFDMILSGQIGKGMALYNRWASVAGYASAKVISAAPLTIDFRGVMLVFRENDFWVIPCH